MKPDTAAGPQRARTSALVAMLLFTGARVSEVIGADVGDLGTERGRRVLRVTRGDGDRRSLPLPGPAVVRIDAYLARRADLADAEGRAGRPDPGPDANVLFATGTGSGCSPPTCGASCAASPHGPGCRTT